MNDEILVELLGGPCDGATVWLPKGNLVTEVDTPDGKKWRYEAKDMRQLDAERTTFGDSP